MTSTTSRTAPRPPAAWVIRWAASLTSAAASAGQAASRRPEHGQVGQVVAHEADLTGRKPSPSIKVRNGAAFCSCPWSTWAILSSARGARRPGRSAREDRRLLARPVPQRKRHPVADVKMLGLDPCRQRDHAVGQDAVDVGDQKLDRLAPRPDQPAPKPMLSHSSKSAGTSPIRSVTSIRPTRWSPRSTTGSSLILWTFISSNASPRLAPTRTR